MSATIENLPSGWAWVRLGDVCEPSKKRFEPKHDDDRKYVGLEHIEKETGKIIGLGSSTEVTSQKSVFSSGDLLYGKLRPYLNKVAIPDFDGVCSTDILVFEQHGNVSMPFLKFMLLRPEFVKYAQANVNGVQHPRVNAQTVLAYPFPLPPLPEQARIVEKLERLLARLARAEQALAAAETGLARFRQSVLKEAFRAEDADGKLKAGWRWVKVKDVGEVVTGTTPSTKEPKLYGNGFPFFKPTDLEQGFETIEARDSLSKLGIQQARLLPAKSILVTCIGATIGKTGFSRKAGATNQQINAIVPNGLLCPEFGYFFAISEFFQKQIKENASATTLPILNKSKFENLLFVLPDLPTQTQIVQKIEHELTRARALSTAAQQARAECGRLRQSILREAFAGRLLPQDPADEPAEVLLARLRAGTGKAPKTRQKK